METKETVIYLVRHGQSIGNLNRWILGHTDLDLTDVGYSQAEKCAEYMKEIKVDKIYASDLKRAYNTAMPHAKLRTLTPILTRELRELYFGDWDGVPVSDVSDSEMFISAWKNNFGTFKSPGGESVRHLASRVYNYILSIASENPGKSLMFVFHAAAIRAFWGRVSGIPCEVLAEKLPFPLNASVSVLHFKNGMFYPVMYSDASFLEEKPIPLF